MSSTPLSIRFDPALLDRLRRGAAARGTTPSGLAQRLVDEGLRCQEFPGIVFRDGPSGRRAAVVAGPDVWEVVRAVRDSELRTDAAIDTASVELDLPVATVRLAVAYYGSYPREIDAEIAENERAADDARRSWESQQRLLA